MPREFLGWYSHHYVEDIQALTAGWYQEPLYAGWEATSNFADTGERFGLVTAEDPKLESFSGVFNEGYGEEEGLGDEPDDEGWLFTEEQDEGDGLSTSAR